MTVALSLQAKPAILRESESHVDVMVDVRPLLSPDAESQSVIWASPVAWECGRHERQRVLFSSVPRVPTLHTAPLTVTLR